MKNTYILIIITLLHLTTKAQNTVEISGQVKDAESKNPIEFCSVSIFNQTDSLINGTVSDTKGFFNINLIPGKYKMVLSFIGYISDTVRFIARTDNFLGVIKLKPDVSVLGEVSVKAASSENQLDRDVQIVTEKMKEGASSTKDVLDKLNGVDLDRYNNSIKVDNNSNVIILVDGLEKDQEYIKNLSPARLKKIEVIRDPGGRYALEGYTAVINVILKQDYEGIDVFVSGRSMDDADAIETKYIPVQNNASATVNYTYNKLNAYVECNQNNNNFNLSSIVTKQYSNGITFLSEPPDNSDMNTHVKQMNNSATLGADYHLNPKHTISFESNLSGQPKTYNISDENYYVRYNLDGNTLFDYNMESNNQTGNLSSYQSAFYVGNLDSNNVINSNFTYFNYADNYVNSYSENGVTERTETGTNKRNSTEYYIEYTHTFKNKTSFQSGYGNSWKKTNNNYIVDSSTQNFIYSDFRNKLYAYYSAILSKKLSLKIGAAGEISTPVANGIKNTYFIAQPYADLKYNLNKYVGLKLKYRSASSYPNISQTNPFVSTIDQQSVRIGNPLLKPEVTHRISMQTDILGGLITIEPYFHFSTNIITETGALRTDSIFEYNFSNAGFYKNYGLEAHLTIPFSKSIFLQSNFDFFNSSITYNNRKNNVTDWTMMDQLIYQNPKTGLVAGLQYQNNLRKFITALGYSKGDNDFWIVFVQQPFLKKRLSVMLLYFLPINWGVDFNQGSYISTDNYAETKAYNIDLLKNMLMLEVSYRFSKGKSINRTEKNIKQKNEKASKGFF